MEDHLLVLEGVNLRLDGQDIGPFTFFLGLAPIAVGQITLTLGLSIHGLLQIFVVGFFQLTDLGHGLFFGLVVPGLFGGLLFGESPLFLEGAAFLHQHGKQGVGFLDLGLGFGRVLAGQFLFGAVDELDGFFIENGVVRAAFNLI